ncbi:MAG: T9SS type A sorting domain-containing protein [Saprospirales bacterium]|nr:T9SS type A sorting domain-containing protein [Saprospirales bacterium]
MLFSIYEISGKLIYQENKYIEQGFSKFPLNFNNKLAKGIYIIKAIDSNHVASQKIWIY